MHRRPAALAALALLCAALARPALATGPCTVASDVTDDVVLLDQPVTSGLVSFGSIDLTGITAATNGGDLVLTIDVVDLTSPLIAPTGAEWLLAFDVNGTSWLTGGEVAFSAPAGLYWVGTGGTYTEITGSYDVATNTVEFDIPLSTLGAAAGDTVSGFEADGNYTFFQVGNSDNATVKIGASDHATSVLSYSVGATC